MKWGEERPAVKAHNAPPERRRHRAYHEEPTKPPEGFRHFVTSMTVQVTLGGHFEKKNADPKRYAVLPTFVMPYQALLSC